MEETRRSRRRLLSFGLTAGLLSIAALSCGTVWVHHCLKLKESRRKVLLQLGEDDSHIVREPAGPFGNMQAILAAAAPAALLQPAERYPISWLRRLLGDESVYCIIWLEGSFEPTYEKEIIAAFPEATIYRAPFSLTP